MKIAQPKTTAKQAAQSMGKANAVAQLQPKMSDSEKDELIARLLAENAALSVTKGVGLKVGEKGTVCATNVNGRFPASFYASQWVRIHVALFADGTLWRFILEHAAELSARTETEAQETISYAKKQLGLA